MKQMILQKLNEIEARENVRILLAVESGSRAWGFASPDSDYDVRFIYIRTPQDYLKLNEMRDVIEEPVNDVFDISGWDLKKALRLLHNANPTLFEWLNSPICYRETDFSRTLRQDTARYFSPMKALFHYVSMAERNKKTLSSGNLVKAKKYFYVLRPVLACKWILETNSPPPMRFSKLVQAELPETLAPTVEELLYLKMNAPETKLIPRIGPLERYLEESIAEIRLAAQSVSKAPQSDWALLNALFLKTLYNE